MRLISLFLLSLYLMLSGCSDTPSPEELQKFAATETYPEDSFLDTVKNKRALVIVAHDDDDCGMAGTIAGLTRKGWRIMQLSLTQHLVEGENRNAAHPICLGNKLILSYGFYRMVLD